MDQFFEILSAWNWAVIAACVSAFAAIVALILSFNQVRLSNKQNLFNRRLSVWLITRGLLKLYEKAGKDLKKDAEPQLSLDVQFSWLTNSTFFDDVGFVAFYPLDMKYQKPFLKKLDELETLSVESRFIFEGELAKAISNYLANYKQLLMAIYQYQVLMSRIKQAADNFRWTLERACGELNEQYQRNELYEVYDAILIAYNHLRSEKLVKATEKQIRLTRK